MAIRNFGTKLVLKPLAASQTKCSYVVDVCVLNVVRRSEACVLDVRETVGSRSLTVRGALPRRRRFDLAPLRHLALLRGLNLNEPTKFHWRTYRLIKIGLSFDYDDDQQEELAIC